MFANNLKLTFSTSKYASIDLRQTFIWTSVWDMQLNAAKFQYVHLEYRPVLPLVLPGDTGNLISMALVKTVNLKVIVNSEFKSFVQLTAAVLKVI